MHMNYKMLTVGLVMVAILVALFTTAVLAAPNSAGVTGTSGSVAYGAQNGYGQQNCQGTCDGDCDQNCEGTCDGNCDQNKGQGSGQCDGTCNNGRQGSATRGNNRGCNGTCLDK